MGEAHAAWLVLRHFTVLTAFGTGVLMTTASAGREFWGAAAARAALPPPPPIPIADFVPEYFTFTARVSGMAPPPVNPTNVRTVVEWGWGQVPYGAPGTTVGFRPSQPVNFTRARTGAYWARTYPNTYGLLPQYFLGHQGADSFLVTRLFFCHVGLEPSRDPAIRPANQTTEVEVNVTLSDGEKLQLTGVLMWAGLQAGGGGACDGLGILIGKRRTTGKYFLETFREYNARRYWPAFG
eukprot:SAG31_NODE_12813_length_914_cov_1.541104_1_plen_237_part_10